MADKFLDANPKFHKIASVNAGELVHCPICCSRWPWLCRPFQLVTHLPRLESSSWGVARVQHEVAWNWQQRLPSGLWSTWFWHARPAPMSHVYLWLLCEGWGSGLAVSRWSALDRSDSLRATRNWYKHSIPVSVHPTWTLFTLFTGKTFFLWYLLVCLLRMKQPILLHLTRTTSLLFWNSVAYSSPCDEVHLPPLWIIHSFGCSLISRISGHLQVSQSLWGVSWFKHHPPLIDCSKHGESSKVPFSLCSHYGLVMSSQLHKNHMKVEFPTSNILSM